MHQKTFPYFLFPHFKGRTRDCVPACALSACNYHWERAKKKKKPKHHKVLVSSHSQAHFQEYFYVAGFRTV